MAFVMVNLPRGEAEQDGEEGAPAQAHDGPQPAGQDGQPLVVNIINVNIIYDPNAVQLVVENGIPAEERNPPPLRLNGEAEMENGIGAGQLQQQNVVDLEVAPDQGAGPLIEEDDEDYEVPRNKWTDSGVDTGYEPDDESGDSSSDEEDVQLYE